MSGRLSLRRRVSSRVGGFLLALALRVLGATWRVRVVGDDPLAEGKVRLGTAWHRDALMAAWFFRDRRLMAPVSLSDEGHLFDRALQHMGYAPSARGSSSRGAVGLMRQLLRGLRQGLTVAVLPDGPKGPPRVCKPGVVALAAAGGVPIVPVAFSARPAVPNRNWDGTSIPLPFARVVVRFGPELAVPRHLDADGRDKLLAELTRRLDALRIEVDDLAGVPRDVPEATEALRDG